MPEYTAEQLYGLHRSGGGTLTWRQLAEHTGYTYDKCRGMVRAYKDNYCVDSPVREISQINPNITEISMRSSRVITLEDLIRECKVDLNVWHVEAYKTKAWEGYAKRERTDLEYDAGRASGTIERGGIETETLWSVWAQFVRKQPVSVHPVIHPVKCDITYPKPKKGKRGGRRALFTGDWQIGYTRARDLVPFHDRRVLDLTLQLAVAAEVDDLCLGGDILDMSEFSDHFAVQPECYNTTQAALYETHWWLRRFRASLPDTRIFWNVGNHEERMQRLLTKHLPAAYGLKKVSFGKEVYAALSIPNLLDLNSLGIEWCDGYPDDTQWLSKELCVYHGHIARSSPGSTAAAVVDFKRANTIFFHIHRQEMASRAWETRDGQVTATAYCPGCACHLDGRVPGSKRGDNWQNGCCIVDYTPEILSVNMIQIRNGKAVYNCGIYDGQDVTDWIRQDLPECGL